jgi:hypothetical protein
MARKLRDLGALTATDFAAARSPEGRTWLAAAPSVPDDLADRWHLTITDDLLWHGFSSIVLLPDAHAITALLDTIVDNGHLDRTKSIAWSFVRAVDYWLWALENARTVDPLRRERVAGALGTS